MVGAQKIAFAEECNVVGQAAKECRVAFDVVAHLSGKFTDFLYNLLFVAERLTLQSSDFVPHSHDIVVFLFSFTIRIQSAVTVCKPEIGR